MSEAGPEGLGRGVASLTAVRLVGMAAAMMVSVVGARTLGPEGVGSVGIAQTLAILVGLVGNGGVTMATIYLVGRARGAPSVAGPLLLLAAVSSLAAGLLTFVTCVVLGPLANFPLELYTPTALLAAVTVALETFAAVLLGRGMITGYVATDLLRSLAILGLTVAGLALLPTPACMVLAAAGGTGAGLAAVVILLRRAMPGVRLRPSTEIWRAALVYGAKGQVGNVLQFVTLRFDTLLVAALAGPAATGLYVIAAKISEAGVQVANAGATLLFPVVARDSSGGVDATGRLLRQASLVVAGSGVLVGVLAMPGLPLVFGPAFSEAMTTVWLLLVAAIPLSMGRVLASHVKGRGHPGLVSIAAMVGLVVTIIGDMVLIPSRGIEGAAMVSIVAYTSTTLVLWLIYRRTRAEPVDPSENPTRESATAPARAGGADSSRSGSHS